MRQQSIAVLPPPSTTTRRPIEWVWPKNTLASHSMPTRTLFAASAAAGNVEVAPVRRAAADEDRVVALAEQRLEAVDASRGDETAAGRQRVADLFVDHFVGQAEFRDLAAHHAAGARIGIEHDDLVADRGEIAGDGQRGGPARRRRRCACRCASPAPSAEGRRCPPCGPPRPASAGRSRPAAPRGARAGRRARKGGRRCGRGFRERRSTSS